MANKKKALTAAYDAIIGKPEEKKSSPVGVSLEAEELERLGEIADTLGVSRHQVLQYAVRSFLKRWAAGERPEFITETVKRLKA